MLTLHPKPDAPPPEETAVIVPVPAVDALVEGHRSRFDTAAAWGVPAHVTVLYPFVAPSEVDASVVARLAGAVASVPAFGCAFRSTGWFAQDVLWLDPDPAQPFRELTEAIWRAFPECPPYGGVHADIVPHVTVAERRLADVDAMRTVADELSGVLPVPVRVEGALLVAGARAPDSWRVLHELPLGQAPSEAASRRNPSSSPTTGA